MNRSSARPGQRLVGRAQDPERIRAPVARRNTRVRQTAGGSKRKDSVRWRLRTRRSGAAVALRRSPSPSTTASSRSPSVGSGAPPRWRQCFHHSISSRLSNSYAGGSLEDGLEALRLARARRAGRPRAARRRARDARAASRCGEQTRPAACASRRARGAGRGRRRAGPRSRPRGRRRTRTSPGASR